MVELGDPRASKPAHPTCAAGATLADTKAAGMVDEMGEWERRDMHGTSGLVGAARATPAAAARLPAGDPPPWGGYVAHGPPPARQLPRQLQGHQLMRAHALPLAVQRTKHAAASSPAAATTRGQGSSGGARRGARPGGGAPAATPTQQPRRPRLRATARPPPMRPWPGSTRCSDRRQAGARAAPPQLRPAALWGAARRLRLATRC